MTVAVAAGRDRAATTVGVDLASQESRTAVCRIRWAEEVTVETWAAGVDDRTLADLIRSPEIDKVGIDVPLGWPATFVGALTSYMGGGAWAPSHRDPALRLRVTDRHVAAFGRNPLSVSSDRIAIPAMRAARLLSSIDPSFDRSGRGRVVEVYPAGSLLAWRLPPDRYKGAGGREVRTALVDRFIEETSAWVTIDDERRSACVADDNVFDALICALTARAAQLRLCHPVPEEHAGAARIEGWIALPEPGTLARLAGAPGA